MVARWILPILIVLGALFFAFYPRVPTEKGADNEPDTRYEQPYDRVNPGMRESGN